MGRKLNGKPARQVSQIVSPLLSQEEAEMSITKKQVTLFGRSIPLVVIVVIVLSFLVLSCCCLMLAMPSSEDPTSTVENTQAPTSTKPVTDLPTSTNTPAPIYTPEPTNIPESTPTLEPSKTPTAAITPTPSPTLEPSPTELVFNFNTRFEDGKIYFDIETNLPDGMDIMFTVVSGEDVWGQSKVQVSSGFIIAGPFSRQGEPYSPGEYELSVSSPLLRLQPPEVQQILGENGENFYGDFIEEGRVDFETTFTVEGDQEETQRLKEQELLSMQAHLTYLNDKLDSLDQAKDKDIADWTGWSREWNIDLQEHRETFDQEFGANINEYKGYCRNAFLDIGIAYGDIFILWQSYDDFVEGELTESELQTWVANLRTLLDEAEIALTTCQEN